MAFEFHANGTKASARLHAEQFRERDLALTRIGSHLVDQSLRSRECSESGVQLDRHVGQSFDHQLTMQDLLLVSNNLLLRCRRQFSDMFLHELPVGLERRMHSDGQTVAVAQRRTHTANGIFRNQHPILHRTTQGVGEFLEVFGRLLNAVKSHEQSQDLVRALENAVDARVTKVALVWPRFHESATARKLHQFVSASPHQFAGKHLCASRLQRRVHLVGIQRGGQRAHHGIGRVRFGRHRGHLALRNFE